MLSFMTDKQPQLAVRFSSVHLQLSESEDPLLRHSYRHIKGLVSSSAHSIVSEYIMKVPGSLVNGREVRRERADKDIA